MSTQKAVGYSPQENGFSLVELMVAMVIGLILLAGISSIMVSSKKSYTTQDSLARLQENARIAMLIMTRELRNVGYVGCNSDLGSITNILNGGASNFDYNLGVMLEGSENVGNWYPTDTALTTALTNINPRAGTDLFMVRGAEADGSLQLTGKMNNQAASLSIAANTSITPGEILILSDCSSTDIFQATNVTGGGTNIIHNTGSSGEQPGNAKLANGAKLSKAYNTEAKLMKFRSNIFFVAPGTSGEPALFRRRVTTSGGFTTEELVEGIENLQVLYGEDTSSPGDRIPDVYRKADAVTNWDGVVTIRFGIISRALASLQSSDKKTTNRVDDTKPLDVDGDGINDFLGTETTTTTTESGTVVKDIRYDRRMFRTTIVLRNFVNREAS